MVQVVSRPTEKEVTCSCGVVLRYHPSEAKVKELSSEGSYFFNMETILYIDCPVCHKHVRVGNNYGTSC
ncbi:MAG: hypothetical protein RR212_05750 [Bacteroidales bacterium]